MCVQGGRRNLNVINHAEDYGERVWVVKNELVH